MVGYVRILVECNCVCKKLLKIVKTILNAWIKFVLNNYKIKNCAIQKFKIWNCKFEIKFENIEMNKSCWIRKKRSSSFNLCKQFFTIICNIINNEYYELYCNRKVTDLAQFF